jgi:uncharacterized protein YqgV (UPF0045/DUF77 family)
MVFEVKISPLGGNAGVCDGVADIRRMLQNSFSSLCVTPSRVWLEGNRSDVVTLLRRCQSQAQSLSIRVLANSFDEQNATASDTARPQMQKQASGGADPSIL